MIEDKHAGSASPSGRRIHRIWIQYRLLCVDI